MNEKKITAEIKESDNVESILNLEPLRGPNGYSAYELYVKNLPEGETPLTELQWLESISKANYYRQYKQTTITTEANTTIIPINISEYNETCLLEAFLNGLRLDDTEYTVNSISKQIVLENPISIDQTIHLIVTKTIVATENDYDLLKGDKGADGIDGLGVPAGGTTGQVLAKKSDADNDTEWIDPPEGTGGAVTVVDALSSDSSIDALSARQGKILDEKIKDVSPTELYSIDKTFKEAKTGTVIALTDDITKYKRVVIYAMNNEGVMNSCEVYNPQLNDKFSIFVAGSGSRSGYYAFNGITRKFTISDKQSITYNEATTLTSHTASQSNLQGFVVDSKNLMIYAILGFEN